MATRPHIVKTQTEQAVDLDRLLRQREGNSPLRRGVADSPRNLFEMDNVKAFAADDGQHLAYNYTLGMHVMQARQYTFSMNDVLTVKETTPLDLEYSGILQKLRIRLDVAPVSSVVAQLYLNGSSLLTVTLGAGVFVGEAVMNTRVRVLSARDAFLLSLPVDVVKVGITTTDGTAAKLTGSVIM